MVNNRFFCFIFIILFTCVFPESIKADTLTFIAEFERYSEETEISDFTVIVEIGTKSYEKQIESNNTATFSIVLSGNYLGPLYLSIKSNTMLTPKEKKINKIPFWLSYIKGLRPTTLYLSADGRIYKDSDSVMKIKIGDLVATPVFDPVPEVIDEQGNVERFSISQDVMITTVTADAVIKYTIDGSNPETNGVEIANGENVTLTTTTTLTAIGVKDGWINSHTNTIKYLFKVADPEIVCDENNSVSITSKTEYAVIWYTIDGKTPKPGAKDILLYEDPFVIEKNTTIKVIATRSGDENSEIVEITFTIE